MTGIMSKTEYPFGSAETGAQPIVVSATERRKTRRRRLISLARLPIMLSGNLQRFDHRQGARPLSAWSPCD